MKLWLLKVKLSVDAITTLNLKEPICFVYKEGALFGNKHILDIWYFQSLQILTFKRRLMDLCPLFQ